MKHSYKLSLFLFAWFLFIHTSVIAQSGLSIHPDLLTKQWASNWIAHPEASKEEYGVYHFRRTFELENKPQSFIVHVTADNRYRLYVNGNPIGFGPARGDKLHWQYETYDLGPFLKSGENVIGALVWNMGNFRPMAQMTMGATSFLMQGNTEKESTVNTNSKNWKVIQNKGYKPYPVSPQMILNQYYAVGACDSLSAIEYPWGWEKIAYNDQNWLTPKQVRAAIPASYAFGYGEAEGSLQPRSIPMMEEKQQRFGKIVRTNGVKIQNSFLTGDKPIVIPANSQVSMLIDQMYLTTAYPELRLSGGKGSSIDIAYAESLVDRNHVKGNRNDIKDKTLYGYHDAFLPDGGENRLFRPLWYRTFRYLEVTITTKDQPLTLLDFYGMFTAYPFQEKASFSSKEVEHKQIWDVAWRTARLCANETYYDTPYYEQLQYIGDTRIQALISLHISGDDRLMRNALRQFNNSRIAEGLTQSRFPTDQVQMIPPFSLYWVDMVHDYYRYRKDDAFLQQFLPGIQVTLSWFENHLNSNHLLSNLGWWSFVDWAPQFTRGVPAGSEDEKGTSIITLQYVYALDKAAELFEHFGKSSDALKYRKLADTIRKAVYEHCFDQQKQLFADTPEKQQSSQHANVMAILTNVVPSNQQGALMQKVLTDKSLIQCTIYYKYYLMEALKKAGMGDQYVANLDTWKAMLAQGLTTFPEEDSDKTRSDCHAWSSSPLIHFLSIVLGIEPASSGFKIVRVEPKLGSLKTASGKMPHPAGDIKVDLKRKGKEGITAEITLPPGVTGEFIWNNEAITLNSGKQVISK